jgi:RND family efflux transporter MFP subunit
MLATKEYVSAQDSQTTEATARVARQTEKQLRAIHDYRELRAPFDGTVTARFADPGALLGASTSPLVTVSKYDHLRIYAYVDQRRAASVRVGDSADIHFPEEREVRKAEVTRIAGELDPRTRMMLVEMDLPNPSEILPGGFCDVTLSLREPPSLEIPAEALLVDGERTQVVVIDAQSLVRFKPVDVLSNDGQKARLSPHGALHSGDHVAIGLGFRVVEGGKVQPVEGTPKK